MPTDLREYAGSQFRIILQQRTKTVAEPLLAKLEQAFIWGNVASAAAAAGAPNLDEKRQDKIHRQQIGTLARSLGHMVASATPAGDVDADAVRAGYLRWKGTRSFQIYAPRYHLRGEDARAKDAEIHRL
ncbi:hypothetical protein J2W22_003075 [Sphingomonas kyeonggiensis]|uniref:hypothetical protein n=1 Tax=Sphingomonas kyeonggiensis TaxID=1268553 RepID=UPI002782097A|nr:hypothetical protein [Sphingomonas kyeonggiensis]MDQ0251011.1 hypothetical protein [Sphingomonas kyeonggiensis]